MAKNQSLSQLGSHIREIRRKQGISQEQLALLAEVDRSYVGGIERGERNVSFLTLVKLADCLNCSVADFSIGIPFKKKKK